MAQVNVIGRITADLELKTSEKSNPYVRFDIAENRQRIICFPNKPCKFISVHFRHHNVQYNQINMLFVQSLQRFFSVGCRCYGVPSCISLYCAAGGYS